MNLQDYRNKIDTIDKEIVQLLADRMEVSKKIGAFKKENSLPVLDEKREAEKLLEIEALAKDSKTEICTIYRAIFEESRKCQE